MWEVFEVRRHVDRANAVSSGLEEGWLTFIADGAKRRLPEYPPEWWSSTDSALELLCLQARAAAPSASLKTSSVARTTTAAEPVAVSVTLDGHGPQLAPGETLSTSATATSPADDVVRELARTARSARLPAVEAMMRLRRLLTESGIEAGSTAFRAARRVFVDAFYFG